MSSDATQHTAPRLISLPPRPDPGASHSPPRRQKRPWLILSFVIAVILPTLAGAVYFALIAADRYAVTTGFALRGLAPPAAIDGIAALTGMVGSGGTGADTAMIVQFLHSRDLVDRVQAQLDLRAIYTHPTADPAMRLPSDASAERLLRHWQKMTSPRLDSGSGLITVEVQAFTPGEARAIAAAILAETTALIGRLSETARADAIRFAEAEVARAEDRLRQAIEAQRDSRADLRTFDPVSSLQGDLATLAGMEAQLSDLRTRIAAAAGLSPDAPALLALQRQAAALQDQIASRNAAAGQSGAPPPMAAQLAAAERLEMEKQFAQTLYGSALASLEQARVAADRQSRYLAIFAPPVLPEQAIYPRRLENSLLIAALSAVIWGIGTLIVYAVRDHAT
jgi:capsular polysaccharide transport system permease protein